MVAVTQAIRTAIDLLADYRPLPGVPDELVDASGRMRPVWGGLLDHLARSDPATLVADFGRGQQYLRDAGVFFRKYGDAGIGGRDWPLSPLPVILAEAEWLQIAQGLMQRADMLELVVADLYGSNRLVSDGHLPGSLIAESPHWLRPMVGVQPASGHFLHFLAFELGRGPDGRWWVLGDRTEAPSGAGFALENRVATSRIFPELYRDSNVQRLAGFFGAFRTALEGLGGPGTGPGGRVAIFTPGPMTDTYYEQAYIARYLGLPLLEGGDLTVQDGTLHVRTVDGLSPLNVLWRRLDSAWADPLELEEVSRLGTPGLLSAIRAGNVTLVNALGTGVLETQALLAFLPGIAEVLTGRPLALPNIATWWCGGAKERAHVAANARRMLIGPALSTRLPLETDGTFALAGTLKGGTGDFADWLNRNAAGLVGQELVTLSTTPVWDDGCLTPRPMTLRMFLARTPLGWRVMPGGFARIGTTPDATAIAMGQGSSVADVWIVADRTVEPATLLPHPALAFVRTDPGPLPSRAADNLYWLGRYIERTEGILRLTRAYNGRLDEAGTHRAPLLVAVAGCLESFGVEAAEPLPAGLCATLAAAVNSAGNIRDRFSVDGWAALSDLEKTLSRMAGTVTAGNDAALAMGILLRKITGFSGLVHENMYRATGWRFLTIGRALERAATMAQLLAILADPDAPAGGLDLAIELGDSAMTHRQRYAVTSQRDSVVDLLALDARNPRSMLFQLGEIRDQAEALAGGPMKGQLSGFGRRVLAVQTAVAIQSPQSMDSAALRSVRGDILALSAHLSQTHNL